MTDYAIATRSIPVPPSIRPWRIVLVIVLTMIADWLLFGQPVGISLALFVLAVAAGILAANRSETDIRTTLICSGLLVAAVLPLAEDVNVMTVLSAAFGLGSFSLATTASLRGDLKERLVAIGWMLLSAPFQIFPDLPLLGSWLRERGLTVGVPILKGWIVPLVVGTIFVALFAAANPLIADWFANLPIKSSLQQIDGKRPLFWIIVFAVLWGIIRACGRLFPRPEVGDLAVAPSPAALPDRLFDETAIRRSLVLFNLLFAVQTVMDINYLWRGAALPDGMSYASYAHRGAYPLIITALLAAAFVIVAMRPDSQAERSPTTRILVFLWIAQNVLLVASSMLRLHLYVATYLLTYWRAAAFIWMLLVAAGLILIVVRIVTHRSNAWMVSANLALLALTIWICGFINFPFLVARYNVDHADGRAASGQSIDLCYIVALGPQAIPALDRYAAATGKPLPDFVRGRRDQFATAHLRDAASWRAWTFRGRRLTRYLQESSPLP
jgi:Domain of unknown function (DUF4173)